MASDSTTPVQITPEEWQAFVTARPRPVKKSQHRDDQAQKLDAQLLSFLNDASKATLSLRANSYQRKWLHITVEYLNMASHSDNDVGGVSHMKTITITKRANTGLPVNMGEAIKQNTKSREASEQIRKAAKRQAKQAKRAKIQEAMDRWSTDCRECGQHLTAYSALYHHSGAGPLCEECVEGDANLSGLKWEPKCTFWD